MKKFFTLLSLSVLFCPSSHAQVGAEIPFDRDGCYDEGTQYDICVNQHAIDRLTGTIATLRKKDADYGKPSGLVTEMQGLLDQANRRKKELAGSETAAMKEHSARKVKGDAIKKSAEARVCAPGSTESVNCSDGYTYYRKKSTSVTDELSKAYGLAVPGPGYSLSSDPKAMNLPASKAQAAPCGLVNGIHCQY
jgi:hypothetical protein